MLSTYKEVAEIIHKKVKQINWIDLDKGQLDEPERFESLIVPAVLIGQSEIEWADLTSRFQQGTGMITVKTCFVLPAHTQLTAPHLTKQIEKMYDTADQVREAVLTTPGIMSRVKSSDYPTDRYYVIEESFSTVFKCGPEFTTKQVQVRVNPFLYKPTAEA